MLDHVSTTRYNTKLGSNDQAMAPGPIQDNHRTTSPTCVPNIRDSWGKISTLEQVAAHHHGTERRAKKELQWNGPNTYNRTNWKILQGVVTEKTNGAFSPRQSSQQQRNKHGRKKKKKKQTGCYSWLAYNFLQKLHAHRLRHPSADERCGTLTKATKATQKTHWIDLGLQHEPTHTKVPETFTFCVVKSNMANFRWFENKIPWIIGTHESSHQSLDTHKTVDLTPKYSDLVTRLIPILSLPIFL